MKKNDCIRWNTEARSYEESRIIWRVMTLGSNCKDWDAKEKCWLKHSPDLWAPFFTGNSLSAGLHRINNIFAWAVWYDAPHQTSSARHLGQWMMTAINPNAKPAARGIKLVSLFQERCSRHHDVEVGIFYSFSPVWSSEWSKSSTSQIYKVHIITQPQLMLITHNIGDL